MKYRKKPVVIEAIENQGSWPPIMAWLDSISKGERYSVPIGTVPPVRRSPNGSLVIDTLEGTMRCDIGDYVIQGVKGELYPCKPDIFQATYEPAE